VIDFQFIPKQAAGSPVKKPEPLISLALVMLLARCSEISVGHKGSEVSSTKATINRKK
jgi:hypothetical protein